MKLLGGSMGSRKSFHALSIRLARSYPAPSAFFQNRSFLFFTSAKWCGLQQVRVCDSQIKPASSSTNSDRPTTGSTLRATTGRFFDVLFLFIGSFLRRGATVSRGVRPGGHRMTKDDLQLINILSQRIIELDGNMREGFASELRSIAIEASHSYRRDDTHARSLVIDCIRRSLRWWREVGHDRHYSEHCTAQVVKCLQAAERTPDANEALATTYDVLIELLEHIFNLPTDEKCFLTSYIESMANDCRHAVSLRNDNALNLLSLWEQFQANSYPEFVHRLLVWCYDNDNYHHVSDACGWLFGSLPVTNEIRQILEKGIGDCSKSERLRERFQWIYSRHFNR